VQGLGSTKALAGMQCDMPWNREPPRLTTLALGVWPWLISVTSWPASTPRRADLSHPERHYLYQRIKVRAEQSRFRLRLLEIGQYHSKQQLYSLKEHHSVDMQLDFLTGPDKNLGTGVVDTQHHRRLSISLYYLATTMVSVVESGNTMLIN
jgi:hypothetical protein